MKCEVDWILIKATNSSNCFLVVSGVGSVSYRTKVQKLLCKIIDI